MKYEKTQFEYFLTNLKRAAKRHGGEKVLTLQHLISIARNAQAKVSKEETEKALAPKGEVRYPLDKNETKNT